MANFDRAINVILQHEGGYVNDPNDPGGETKFGISKRSYPNVDIKNLTIQDAKAIYKIDFWDKLDLNKVNDESLALQVFDHAVNAGRGSSLKILKSLGFVSAVDTNNSIKPVSEIFAEHRILFYKKLKNFPRYGKSWIRRVENIKKKAL